MGVGSRIKEMREKKGLKQKELAKMIDVTPGAIANYENEVSHPKVDILYKLLAALDCDANYLFQDMVALDKNQVYSAPEKDLIDKYRSLDSHGKEAVEATLNIESKRMDEMREQDRKMSKNKMTPSNKV